MEVDPGGEGDWGFVLQDGSDIQSCWEICKWVTDFLAKLGVERDVAILDFL